MNAAEWFVASLFGFALIAVGLGILFTLADIVTALHLMDVACS